jgi:glycosyltransferase involved in cell wall biosynthesis
MSDPPFQGTISVVVPVHRADLPVHRIQEALADRPGVELVLVLNGEAVGLDLRPRSHGRVVVSQRAGRGHALVKGAKEARGEAVLFLHSDTTLPNAWEQEVRRILGDSRVVGGAFSLSFDTPRLSMWAMARLSDLWLDVTGHVWGDRAMFVRSEVLQECLNSMDVPIFEDVRLSQQMRQRGKVEISPEMVVTSWDAFRRHGVLGHLAVIVKCHYWYLIGWESERIYERYYH